MAKRRKETALAVRNLARQLQKILDGERVLNDLPALETKVQGLENRLSSLEEMVGEIHERVAVFHGDLTKEYDERLKKIEFWAERVAKAALRE